MIKRAFYWGFALCAGAVILAGCGAESKQAARPTASRKTAEPTDGKANYDVASAPADEAFPNGPVEASPPDEVVHEPFTLEPPITSEGVGPGQGGDRFDHIEENDFFRSRDTPLSTFSIDVDTASYSKMRMFVSQQGRLPPPSAVRIEEFINYFDYDYPPPQDDRPFAVEVETASCPWNVNHQLAHIGIRGKDVRLEKTHTNLVFLLDVSGSMNSPNKLPLVKQGLAMLLEQLGENDRVAICYYARGTGVALPSTPASKKHTIISAMDRLRAGGSTNGAGGIQLAYETARKSFIKGGVNRVILCTDGDFNVGVTSTGQLVEMAKQRAKDGVFLSVMGFGSGNHNDAMLEQLSNKANGNYSFIDGRAEAYKVLVQQLSGALVTIAKDVKIQVEFNPTKVESYRLIGYENRKLADRDFNDDTKDAGEIGAGHTVTALYELVPVGAPKSESDTAAPAVDPLKYQDRKPSDAAQSDEWLTVKLRYKLPDEDASTKFDKPVTVSQRDFEKASVDFRFAASVAAYGMLLRNSKYKGQATYPIALDIARNSLGRDQSGYRGEFVQLLEQAARLSGAKVSAWTPPVRRETPPWMTSYAVSKPGFEIVGVRMSWGGLVVRVGLAMIGLLLVGLLFVIRPLKGVKKPMEKTGALGIDKP